MKISVETLVGRWTRSPWAPHLCCRRQLPAVAPQFQAFPAWLDRRLVEALTRRGIVQLYDHQWRCAEAAHRGEHLVVATPTASGKSLCYNLPVFSRLLSDPDAHALYLFPTKALARDQVEEARRLAAACGDSAQVGVAVYDGDTLPDERRAAKRRARILATNPEMLHCGILPHHPGWTRFLAGLRYVVVDELHTYRGVFGSHLANVLRRLQRVARLHGASPQLVATSATIANPDELARELFGQPVTLIARSGAPQGERHFVIYNPPVIDRALGIRENYLKAAVKLTLDLVQASISTLLFCRSRLAVEVAVRLLRERLAASDPERQARPGPERIRGYRGGYLPRRRREVEHALRQGETDVVVATSALELGIDIGGLDAVVMAGWPGSRAATWQRAGRAGRRLEPSLAVLVTSSEPVDQYVATDPDYLFGLPPEHARINPDNPSILVPHLKCAAAEIPFVTGERYGSLGSDETEQVLSCLADAALLHRSDAGYHYTGHPNPANDIHLRGPLEQNFLVVEQPGDQVVAEVDFHDAPQVLHDNAIYQLEGHQYQVLRLDHDNHKAFVTQIPVDYYTDAMTHTQVRILERLDHHGTACIGEVHVIHRVVGFKKIKLHTGENVGYGEVRQPERQMHTTALWLNLPPREVRALRRCAAEIAEATLGAAYALHSAAALILMSDPRDLGRAVGDARSGWFAVSGRVSRGGYSVPDRPQGVEPSTAPTIFLFDRYPGGTGLADRLFDQRVELLERAARLIAGCECRGGCPSCIGPGSSDDAKALALRLLGLLAQVLADRGSSPRREPEAVCSDRPPQPPRRPAGHRATADVTTRG